MPHVARLVDEIAWLGVDNVRSQLEPPAALEHERELVLAPVEVDGSGEAPRNDRVLDEREAPVRRIAGHDEPRPDDPELPGDGLRRSNDRAPKAQIEECHGVLPPGFAIPDQPVPQRLTPCSRTRSGSQVIAQKTRLVCVARVRFPGLARLPRAWLHGGG